MKLFKLLWCLIVGHEVEPVHENLNCWLELDGGNKKIVTCKRCKFVYQEN